LDKTNIFANFTAFVKYSSLKPLGFGNR